MVVLDGPVWMFTDPLCKVRLGALHTFAQRTMPDIFDTLFLTLVGMGQRTDREYDGYEVHSATPPSIEPVTGNYHANRICKGLVATSNKNLPFAKDRHIPRETGKRSPQKHGSGLTIRFDHCC